MSKAVLLSIRPDWVKKIASGDKTVEVRKTRPRIDTPFKCYIYCTQASPYNPCVPLHYRRKNSTVYDSFFTARVIGEFMCDEVAHLDMDSIGLGRYEENAFYHYIDSIDGDSEWNTCLTREEVMEYTNGKRPYGWHISDLVIYDKPKKLEEFNLTRAPQSWQYVEELE